jgi:CheY-like chemotaxis protein
VNDLLRHDLLNRVGAAKMNAELALRNQELPVNVRKNLERILANLQAMQEMVEIPKSDSATVLPPSGQPRVLSPTAKRLLLIDDSDDLRTLFATVFSSRGYFVQTAADEAQALAVFKEQPWPELILVDYMLGNRTGSDVLDTLESAGVRSSAVCKIILFTGLDAPTADARFHAVERKSLELKSLIALVEKYCS